MSRQAIITLVHGTWGRGFFPAKQPKKTLSRRSAIWSEPGSSFFSALDQSLRASGYDPTIATFPWSGANSFRERDQTVRKLAQLLDTQAGTAPHACQIVIGHSHGGNIILSAARHYRQLSSPIHLVTLATPFLDVVSGFERGCDEREVARRCDMALNSRKFVLSMLALIVTLSAMVFLVKSGLIVSVNELKHLADIGSLDYHSRVSTYASVQSLVFAVVFGIACLPLYVLLMEFETSLASVAKVDTPAGPSVCWYYVELMTKLHWLSLLDQ